MQDNTPKTNGPEKTVMKFKQVDRLHCFCIESELKSCGFGLNRNQLTALIYIDGCEGNVSQKDISNQLEISTAAVAHIVKELESSGFVERKSDEADTRKNIVTLTEKARKMLAQTKQSADGIDSAMLSGLSDEDMEIFRRCLDVMKGNLEKKIKSKGATL